MAELTLIVFYFGLTLCYWRKQQADVWHVVLCLIAVALWGGMLLFVPGSRIPMLGVAAIMFLSFGWPFQRRGSRAVDGGVRRYFTRSNRTSPACIGTPTIANGVVSAGGFPGSGTRSRHDTISMSPSRRAPRNSATTYTEAQWAWVTAHELGHAIGFEDLTSSDSSKSITIGFASVPPTGLTPRPVDKCGAVSAFPVDLEI